MKTETGGEGANWGARIIACFLVAGGALGVLSSVLMAFHLAHQQQTLRVISEIISAALFAWGVPAGIELWRETPRGFRWAKILFAIQVPVFGAGRFVYEFSTLFSLRVMAGNTIHYLGGNIGSSSNIYLSSQSAGFMFGLNIVAIAAFLYLIRRSRA